MTVHRDRWIVSDAASFRGEAAPLRALLGPTNTGKTHAAIERMLEYPTGMIGLPLRLLAREIGLPLRLLAREIYDRVSARVGEGAVALVTGEEKRLPPHPRYWICTVEAMPGAMSDRKVDFLAVDEIQLCTHRQRGHIFTQRIQHARGQQETWLLGSATMRALLPRLCPQAVVEGRPRLSTLSDGGSMTLSTLPPRSVVVAFSATRVYELAEKIRGKRGGAAVVIGALSPRARNAQVALFQAGEVDTLVATDAIGMGLNLDVDAVVFADLRKFDGREGRALEDAELAQIAGRAGRYHRDGRFATLAPLPTLPPATVRALEQHRFPPAERVFWRNHDLDLDSVDSLLASLRRRPRQPWLRLCDDADDLRALTALARIADVQALARGPERVALLWQVCQIPDFRQLALDDHFHLVAAAFRQLAGGAGQLAGDWIDEHLRRLDRPDGDLETLLDRMSAVRTWTYVTAHRAWVDDAPGWQARTHDIEDRLSDALHQKLVQRFVDEPGHRRRSAARPGPSARAGLRSLAGELAAKIPAARALSEKGGSHAAAPTTTADTAWVEAIIAAPHAQLNVRGDGRIWAGERVVGRLLRGAGRLHPEVTVLPALPGGARLRLARRLLAFARDLVAELLALLPTADETLGPAARGIVYLLQQNLGTVSVASARPQLEALPAAERRRLVGGGIVFGRLALFAPTLLTVSALHRRQALCAAERWPEPLPLPPPSLADGPPPCLSGDDEAGLPYQALGYVPVGAWALRADLAEDLARDVARGAPLAALARRLDLAPPHAADLLAALRAQPGFPVPRRRGRRTGAASVAS
ncbi:MAG TPA: helicase-related protein [Polyangia bacterium]|nr:helicase-related protein [Polyangia bacterium]